MCKQTNGPPPKATLNHILNYCEAFLSERERFTWRHNSVLIYVVETLLERLPPTMDLYADLPGHNINGGTLPPHIAVTHSWPDLVLINKTGRTVLLLELTVSFETNCETAHKRKQERYQALTSDIEDSCFNCNNIPFEIGSRGHITLPNMTTLTTKHALCMKVAGPVLSLWDQDTGNHMSPNYTHLLCYVQSIKCPWMNVKEWLEDRSA